jgi:multimeric flavodoxin WrbA
MRIVVINGSPKGKESNTNRMVDSFLKGAQSEGAETINIFLSEKEIKHCKGCHICWQRGPLQCVTNDDMLEVITQMGGADLIAFASPVYFGNISGMLKAFMDRMTMIGSPHQQKAAAAADGQPGEVPAQGPGLMMISSCGLPDRSEFDVTSLWISKVAKKMNMEVAGELYAVMSRYLADPPEDLRHEVDNYMQLLEKAGREAAFSKKVSETTIELLEKANSCFSASSAIR